MSIGSRRGRSGKHWYRSRSQTQTTSYRAAAEVARRKACRVPSGDAPRRSLANEGQLVANWVDVCSELVCAGELPQRWPDTLAVDSQNFRVRTGRGSWRGFHVLAAVGRDRGELERWAPTPRVWRLEPFAHKDQAAWEVFFGALEGAPRVIVSDADNALRLAIGSAFGEGQLGHRRCEWHLGRAPRRSHPRRPLAPDHPRPLGRLSHLGRLERA